MSERGLTIIELVIVIVLIGLMSVFVIPRIGDTITKQNVRSALNAVVTMHAKARAVAIQRGRSATLVFAGNTLLIVSQSPLTAAIDTVGVPQDFNDRFGVTVISTRDSLVFDARGLGTEAGDTQITVAKGTYSLAVEISPIGRVLK